MRVREKLSCYNTKSIAFSRFSVSWKMEKVENYPFMFNFVAWKLLESNGFPVALELLAFV